MVIFPAHRADRPVESYSLDRDGPPGATRGPRRVRRLRMTAVDDLPPTLDVEINRVAPDADTTAGEHDVSMETIVELCKRRGIIFQSSEIYGGLRGAWDYGPLGAALKDNVKNAWKRKMLQLRDDIVQLD